MSLNRGAVIDAIEAILRANTTPSFTVHVGEPLALAPDYSPWACFWYDGESEPPEGGQTLGNVMVYERFQVMCLWHRRVEPTTLEALEKEIWDANRSLKAAIWGDSTLGGLVTDLDVSDSVTDYGLFPLQGVANAPFYRTLEFQIFVKDLEAEAIAP